MPNAKGKNSPSDGINEFVQKNRKPIFTALIVIAAALAVFIGTISISEALRNKAIAREAEFERRYEALRFDIADPEKD
ncbi:MAG: hypothetical protein LBN21_05100, partial [Treponema sp.]|nr:hypothetical protein [Treponema sp.]